MSQVGAPKCPEWYKAFVEISMIVERHKPDDRVKIMAECFSEFCPKCGFYTIQGHNHPCECLED